MSIAHAIMCILCVIVRKTFTATVAITTYGLFTHGLWVSSLVNTSAGLQSCKSVSWFILIIIYSSQMSERILSLHKTHLQSNPLLHLYFPYTLFILFYAVTSVRNTCVALNYRAWVNTAPITDLRITAQTSINRV